MSDQKKPLTVRPNKRQYDSLRAAAMAIERLGGKSIADIAATYNIPMGEVRKTLDWAKESGFIDHFRNLGFERLMGKAWAVYEARLDMGDLEAARDIAYGLNVLRKEAKTTGELKEKAIRTLEEFHQDREKRLADRPKPEEVH